MGGLTVSTALIHHFNCYFWLPIMRKLLCSVGVFVLISFTNRAKLFCTSENLIEAVQSPTPYCSLVGKEVLREIFLLDTSCSNLFNSMLA